ncbi:hypothetical protein CgS9114_09763 [Corynebacterium glutamicum S9114]|nr:hypothetical protein CgS9114_09763 [Corynebacterium glutamicum S9114]
MADFFGSAVFDPVRPRQPNQMSDADSIWTSLVTWDGF